MNQAANSLADGQDGLQFLTKTLDFLCPVCPDQNLQVGTLCGTQVCCCSECEGFLLDSESLGFLVADQRANYRGRDDKPVMINPRELDEKMQCPACFANMYTHPYHGPGNVVLNSCSHCQLNWLDQGEFAKIIRAPGRR